MSIDKKMSKKIKFALIMDGNKVRTLSELQNKFSLGDLLDDFMDLGKEGKESKLCEWLNDRYLSKQAEEIRRLQDIWEKTKHFSVEEKTNFIWDIQRVFFPDGLPENKTAKKKTREDIEKNYDILTKNDFDDKVKKVKESIGDKYNDDDVWRKYLSRLAWDNESLQKIRTKENVNKIYLLNNCDYKLSYGKLRGVSYEGIPDKENDNPYIKIIENNKVISKDRWEKLCTDNKSIKNNFRSIDIYIQNNGKIEKWENKKAGQDDTKYKGNIYIGNSEAAAREKLARYMDAQYPLIYFKTYEEDKADEIIRDVAGGKRILEWSVEGFFDKGGRPGSRVNEHDRSLFHTLHLLIRQYDSQLFTNGGEKYNDKPKLLMNNTVLVLKDVHELLSEYTIAAQLKYLAQLIYNGALEDCNIIIVSPLQVIPRELENYMVLLDFNHLSDNEIEALVDEFCQGQGNTNIVDENIRKDLVRALKGLTEFQIVNILGVSYAGDGAINKDDLHEIIEQKKQMIRKLGILDIVDVELDENDIGGLKELKGWVGKKAKIFEKWGEAEKKGVRMPKGMLIAGMPGCGKSLCAKVTANMFGGVPLLRMDMGRLMGKYVGESEENMRQALRWAENIAPCVLWIDEVEKAFAGIGGDGGAAEVTTRLFGIFLTWMQEKESLTFVVATANDISKLPPELLRKGRFDEVFYIDLPDTDERKEIFKIHIEKYYKNDIGSYIDLDKLVNKTDGFSGAEIEGVVRESIENVFLETVDNEDEMHLTTEAILKVIDNTSSLKKMFPNKIDELRKIYNKNDFKNASKRLSKKRRFLDFGEK